MTKTKNATVQTYLERKRKNTWCKMTQPRHPTKNIIWGMNERKGKLTYCKHHAAKTTCKSKLTHCKMICPRQPARDNTQDTNANAKKWKHTRKKEQKQRRPSAKSSGQCSQQQTPRWRQGLKAHTHIGKSSKHGINSDKWTYQTTSEQSFGRQVTTGSIRRHGNSHHLGDDWQHMRTNPTEMIQPRHSAKQACGMWETNEKNMKVL